MLTEKIKGELEKFTHMCNFDKVEVILDIIEPEFKNNICELLLKHIHSWWYAYDFEKNECYVYQEFDEGYNCYPI